MEKQNARINELLEIGNKQYANKQYLEASKTYYEMHELSQATDDWVSEQYALQKLGECYYFLTRQSFDESIAVVPGGADKASFAYFIGLFFSEQQDFTQTKKYFERSVELYKNEAELQNDEAFLGWAADSFTELAGFYNTQGEFDKAFDTYQKVVDFVQTVPKQYIGINDPTFILRFAVEQLPQNQRVEFQDRIISFYHQAITIYSQSKDLNGQRMILLDLATLYLKLNQEVEANQHIEQALELFRASKDRLGEAEAFYGIGAVYESLSRYLQAKPAYQEALLIFQEIDDKGGKGRTLNRLGFIQIQLAEYDEAYENLQQSLALLEEVEDILTKRQTLLNLGLVQYYRGQYSEALKIFEDYLVFEQGSPIKDPKGRATALTNVGLIHTENGQYDPANQRYQQAFKIYEDLYTQRLKQLRQVSQETQQVSEQRIDEDTLLIQYRAAQGRTFHNMGFNEGRRRAYSRAVEDYQKALDIRREVKDRYGEGRTLNNLGFSFIKLERFVEAEEYLNEALKAANETGDRSFQARILDSLGTLDREQGKNGSARKYYEAASGIVRELDRERIGNLSQLLKTILNNLALLNN